MDLSTLKNRVVQASLILGITERTLNKILNDNGFDDADLALKILDAKTTDLDTLVAVLSEGVKKKPNAKCPSIFKLKSAASILKGDDPFEKEEQKEAPLEKVPSKDFTETIATLIQANRDPHQMKDKELLQRYIEEREYEVEQELHRRAKFQPFVVLQLGRNQPGNEKLDVEASLDLLKAARRRTNPTMIPLEGKVVPVYRITELNPDDRITELCPICGAGLYKGYCSKCELDFSGIGDDERSYVSLVSKKESFNPNNFSDRRALYASAIKGTEDLRQTWPSVQKEFEELKLLNSLPQLRVIKEMPSEKKIADPFNMNGNRSY